MKKLKQMALSATVLTALWTTPSAAELLIRPDGSTSSALMTSDSYAAAMGESVAKRVARLSLGEYFSIGLFGSLAAGDKVVDRRRVTQRVGERARDFAPRVAAFLAALPAAVRDGRITAATSTNLLGLLMLDLGPKCAAGDVDILILSDARESSSLVPDIRPVLAGEAALPEPPDPTLLASCSSITILGVGDSIDGAISPLEVLNLIKAFEVWLRKAGATNIHVQAGF